MYKSPYLSLTNDTKKKSNNEKTTIRLISNLLKNKLRNTIM